MKSPMVDTCEQCHEVFTYQSSQRFCSKQCRDKAHSQRNALKLHEWAMLPAAERMRTPRPTL